jgi:hypothetical protein
MKLGSWSAVWRERKEFWWTIYAGKVSISLAASGLGSVPVRQSTQRSLVSANGPATPVYNHYPTCLIIQWIHCSSPPTMCECVAGPPNGGISSLTESSFVLTYYKTEPCKRPPRLCRQGYACPFYHNNKDRRRSPRHFKYRSVGVVNQPVGVVRFSTGNAKLLFYIM